jgi:voltage-gated potassium channel Kch
VIVVIDATTDIDVSAFSRAGPSVVRAVLASITPIVVARRVASHRSVSAGTIVGAVSAYLLIALAFSYVFVSIDILQSTPFFGQPESSTRFTYFSLVTMTTLGYGDLAPSSDLVGLTANAEAVTGQLFLVTFVALLIGQRIAARNTEDSDS